MACVDCHQVKQVVQVAPSSEGRYNAPLSENRGVKKSQPELCLQCHQMRRAQLQRSSHMPYREGKVTCTSYHHPHGSPNPSQLIQSTTNENCLSCHTERCGPFLWEHPPVMALSGFLLWFNNFALRYFPKWITDAATAIHWYEALLATFSILLWHFNMVIFDPLVYPIDTAWLDGKVPADHYRHSGRRIYMSRSTQASLFLRTVKLQHRRKQTP